MYKKTSKNTQGRADRILPKDVMGGPEILSEEDKINMLREKLKKIDVQLTALPYRHPDRKQLGKNKAILSYELSKLRKSSHRKGIAQIFYQEARRLLPPDICNKIQLSAEGIWDAQKKMEERVHAEKMTAELKRMEDK